MKDQRADALARILVRYSTEVKEGDVCRDPGETAAEPLLLAVYEEVLRAGGFPIVELTMEGAGAGVLRARRPTTQLDWVAADREWPPRRPTCASG